MEILHLMSKTNEGKTVRRLGSQFALSSKEMAAVLGYVVPYLDDALTRLIASPQGLATLLAQLSSKQYQRDLDATDIFQNSRILANGTGVLSLLLRNEATIRVISFIAAEGTKIDFVIIRRMMPFIATIYICALAKRSNEPLQELAERFSAVVPFDRHGTSNHGTSNLGTSNLAELILSKSPRPKTEQSDDYNRGSIKDILNTLSKIDMDDDTDAHFNF